MLGDDAGAVEHHPRVAAEAVEEHQFLAEQQIVDVTDPRMPAQVFAATQRRRTVEVLLAGVKRQAIVGEFAGDQHVGGRSFEVDADFRLAVEDADETGHRHQFHLQPRIAFEQAIHAAGQEHDAQSFRDPDPDLAQGRRGLGDFLLGQQRDVLHGFGVLEQRLAGRCQLVTLGMLNEQRGAEAFFDGLDVPRDGGVGRVQASGCGQQTSAAL